MMLVSQGARSAGSIGLPRPGPAAEAMPAQNASAIAKAYRSSSRVDMFHLPARIDTPARDGVEVLVREGHRGNGRLQLAARGDEFGARRLHVALLVRGPALQGGGPAIPAPRQTKTGQRPRQYRLLQRGLRPRVAAIGR